MLVLCAEYDKQANLTGNVEEVTKEEIEEMITPNDQK